MVERFATDVERLGTGRATIVSTLSVLQGVMKRALRDYNPSGNPVKQTDKPSQRRARAGAATKPLSTNSPRPTPREPW